MICGKILNDLPRWIVIALWLGANIGVFVEAYLRFETSIDYFYTRRILGPALAWARASAAALNLNCMLILLPVCRNFISFLRSSFRVCCNTNIRRQLDKHITFHRYIAYMIVLQTVIHTGAHIFNVERYFESYNSRSDEDKDLLRALNALGPENNNTYLNFIRDDTGDVILETLKVVAGVSGIAITLALIIMVTSSTELIRRSYFEVFWFTHHLFVIFFLGLVVHGVQKIVRRQSNTDVHNPEQCFQRFNEWNTIAECPNPQFEGLSANAWKWTLGPILLYIIERIIRFYRSQQRVVITKLVKHPSKVFQLQMQRKGFKMSQGQYIFLHCPSISRLEWHPFTLTSAPEDDYFSVHIRRVGDWTEALAKACHVDDTEVQEQWKLPGVAVDGPFGTATEDICLYEVDVFVAAGIGVTPFASILKHIWYLHMDSKAEMKLKKVYFYWVCPDTNSFEWMQDLLQEFDQQQGGVPDNEKFLQYFIYLTRGWDKNQAENIILHENEDESDPVTGLQQKTHYGRPNWNEIFKGLAAENKGTSIGTFFCGPSGLSNTLHQMCNNHSDAGEGTKFYYNKENF
ncbi:cytochrome b-245 heavy chain-like isoform X1 [Pecten maximus]|uniref:cytochrome b-245 heavy chain-like isoform X1 n=2 Tax=Pecten maximus TaxID=6579 RepID=UPI0014582958|nr:cytochrome b-245 heavy chain-like isoform X1 [Pecten maximus]